MPHVSVRGPFDTCNCAEREHPPGWLNRRRTRRRSVPRDHETGSLYRAPVAPQCSLRRIGSYRRRVDLMPPPCPLACRPVSNPLSTTARKPIDLRGFPTVEPAGIEPATSCLQRDPSRRADWHDWLGIHPSEPQTSWAKARLVCRHFSGPWSTQVGPWTSDAAAEPRVLLGAIDAPRGVNARR
jgi:hypothetical protein